ncbi:Upstream activation factor subunit spp27 [Smittium mucronatum]|uniref:Upstream activation factor subunit spp27 n=1 Tax=Smittium mucronatum TaxID=133383 RepID=A0A1R0GRB2_9FUNG|nr:Upstream activation factor subunit spp27 [Smittium mucronatum]
MGVNLSNEKSQVDEIILNQYQYMNNEASRPPQYDNAQYHQQQQQQIAFNYNNYQSPPGIQPNPEQQQFYVKNETYQAPEPKKRGRPSKDTTNVTHDYNSVLIPKPPKPPTKAALAKLEKAALAASKKKKKRAKLPQDPSKPKRVTGLSRPMRLSPELSAFFDRKYMSRTGVVKNIWKYIKLHELQDPIDRRYIMCDEKMRKLFDYERLYMYTMNKELNKHFTSLTPDEIDAAKAEVQLYDETGDVSAAPTTDPPVDELDETLESSPIQNSA